MPLLPQNIAPENADANENWRGILWAMGSVVGASAMAISVRGASFGLDSRVIVAYRGFFSLLILLILLMALPYLRTQVRFSRPWAHILRGSCMCASVNLGFFALSLVPLAAAAVLFATAPIFATIFSVLLGRERVGPRRVGAIAVGFLGAIVVINPGAEVFDTNMLFAIGSSVFFGVALVMGRRLGREDGPMSTLISTTVMTLLLTLPFASSNFGLPTNLSVVFWLAVLVVFGLFRQLADIQAYRYAQAAVIAPISYVRMVLIGIAAYFLFQEVPSLNTYAGGAIIIAATIYITNRERKLKQG
ncbi:S-adenosylmethionine uptake transporter [Amylibacter marinus]|uniref:S-adenosylmethionine uptake transporter n=1 Tax=Amylibacter marinus TaxID=1475483 RepID=A0ABQ5VZ06_9RHOB|nr:DMT family transporter [Amylibacter marinus]GLQ36364.1 S-adenosylmethionine uptake transporter [Amylibacter marinus]